MQELDFFIQYIMGFVIVIGLAGVWKICAFVYEEIVKSYAFRTFELFEQHWSGL